MYRARIAAALAAFALLLGFAAAPAQASITSKSKTTDWGCTFNTIRTTWTYDHDSTGPRNRIRKVRIQVLYGPYITHEYVYDNGYLVISWQSGLTNDITLTESNPTWYHGTVTGAVTTESSKGECMTNATYLS